MKLRNIIFLSIALVMMGCASQNENIKPSSAAEQASQTLSDDFTFNYKTMLEPSNPFAQKSTLPFSIVDFSKIKIEHYKPAFEAGMAQQLEEIDQIANQTADPTFNNTMIPLEKSGELLNRVSYYFSNDAGANTNDEIKALIYQ